MLLVEYRDMTQTIFRTQEQIVNRIRRICKEDFFGFETGDLVGFLELEHAKEFLREDYDISNWKPEDSSREAILERMESYMPFAWDKANDCRGLSAGRSMDHYTAWTWMIGDEDVFGDLSDYEFYGKDNLRKICEYYGWDADKWDDGIRTNG